MKQYYLSSLVKIKSFAFILLTFSLWTGKNAGIAITCLHRNVKILFLIAKSKPNITENRKEALDLCGNFLSVYFT